MQKPWIMITVICLLSSLLLDGCNRTQQNSKDNNISSSEKIGTKTDQEIQKIEAFKPFAWNDSLFNVVEKVQQMPEAEDATISFGIFEPSKIKNLTEASIMKKLKQSLPETQYATEGFGYFSYLDKNGKNTVSNESSIVINIPNVFINNAKYTMRIILTAMPGIDVLYPNNTITSGIFHEPIAIKSIKFEGNNMDDIILHENGQVTKTLLTKYSHITPQIMKMSDGKISNTTIEDELGSSISIGHTTYENPQKRTAAFIEYLAPIKTYEKAYSDRELLFKKTSGASTNMSKNL